MNAGKELDALVAEKVLGWKLEPGIYEENKDILYWVFPDQGLVRLLEKEELPKFSTEINDAWEVVEAIASKDESEPTVLKIYGPLSDGYKVTIVWEHHDGAVELESIIRSTAPHAICLAALKAMGVEL